MVIGAAIGDVTVMPAPKNLPSAGSTPMERIRLSTGGDALNEATVAARLGCELSFVAEIQKGVCTLVDAKNDIAAAPAVSAVGTALGDVFLAAEGNAAVSAAAGFDVYFYFIYKHYVSLMPLSYRLSFYFSALSP